MPAQVAVHSMGGEVAACRLGHGGDDGRVDLGQHPSARRQVRRRLIEEADDEGGAAFARVQGAGGLGCDLRRQTRADRHIRKIRANEVEPAGQGPHQIATLEMHAVMQAVLLNVARSHLERVNIAAIQSQFD